MTNAKLLLLLIFLSNLLAAFSYFLLACILLIVFWKLSLAYFLTKSDDEDTRKMVHIATALNLLFALFMIFCGISHVIHAAEYFNHAGTDDKSFFLIFKCTSLVICSLISICTALFCLSNSTFIYSWINHYKLSSDGSDRLVSAFERMQKSIIILSSDLRIIKGNTITALFFGQHYLGQSIHDVISDHENISKFNDIFQRLDTESHSGTASISIEFKNQLIGSKLIWLESQITRVESAMSDGRIEIEYTMITRNIDTQKKNEILQKTLEASRLQEAVNQSKLMYITSVAHDLKAPLQTFCLGLELILQTTLTVAQKDILKQLFVASEMMKLSISQSIDIGKSLDNRGISPRKSTVSLSEIIEQVEVIMLGSCSSVPISYSISPVIEDSIITDREWLWQMLLNLLTNACKYTIEGSIAVTVDLVEEGADSFLLFQVTDTGIGVSESKKTTIFDAFNQAQVGQVTGTGLGLYGLRCRVEALGGVCGVKDNEAFGSGSVFWFKIPYVTSESSHQMDYEDLNTVDDVIVHSYDSLDEPIDSIILHSNRPNASSNKSLYHDEKSEDETVDSVLPSVPKRDNFFLQNSSSLTAGLPTPIIKQDSRNLNNESIPNTNNPLVLATPPASTIAASVPTAPTLFHVNKIIPVDVASRRSKSTGERLKSFAATTATAASMNRSYPQLIQNSAKLNNKPIKSDSLTFVVPLQIYLIDDSLPILKMTKMTLSNMGFTNVDCFENGYAGLVAMKKKYVDIVFTDVQMPVLTGPEMAQRFRDFERSLLASGERKHRQVIVALTANTSEELNALVPDSFDRICTKPISTQDLRNILKLFCRAKVAEESGEALV